jgi:hypothetical protein
MKNFNFQRAEGIIYSTIKDRNVTWDSAMLKELDKKKIIYTEKQFLKFMRHSEISMGKLLYSYQCF